MNVMTNPPPVGPHAGAPVSDVASSSAIDAAPASPPSWRRRAAIAAGVAALAVAGFAYLTIEKSEHAEAPARPSASAAQPADGSFRLADNEMRSLRIEPVLLRDFRTERLAEGRISYDEDRSTPVFSPYTGRILRVMVRQGDVVAAGQPLFEIETTDLVQATNDLLAAVDNEGKARTTLELARRNEARQRELVQIRAAARRDLEQAEADAANAAADLRVAETAHAAARDRMRVLGRTPDQITEVERTRHVDAVIAVAAPIGGTVVQRRAGAGQWVNAGATDPVATIADLSTVWLVAAVREMDAPDMHVGQPVEVRVNALPGRVFQARVSAIGSSLDATSRRLPVRAEVQDPDGVLKPEMFANFRIAVGGDGNALGVPADAVIHRGAETSVWAALDGNRFALRKVALGRRAGNMFEVRDGLEPGARIVTAGALFIDRAAAAD
ncbi:efflux RND transporter periplasmic adaptor subunit [Roseomonas sp. CAU 1739]|uniref:efflux RND transporter periplasmic adaptor subunit n=1 Tax=Roseomonas sp. CAU 1739 TaxID=3140364 RepID=UPI00325AF6FC